MTLAVTSAPFQSVNMPALDLRRYLGFGLQEGVASSTAMAVAQRGAGANMSVDIAAGEAVVQGDSITNQGLYYAFNDATFNLTGFTAANATNPRIDRVALRVQDQFQGDAANALSFVILTGTATAGATLVNLTGAASVPANHLLLANVLIPATATSITTGNIDTSYLTVRVSASTAATLTTTSTLAGGPPASPVDKQIWYATAVDGSGTRWTFQYNASSGSSFKWEFVGGPGLSAGVAGSIATASTSFVDLTSGPTITVPRAGDYIIEFGLSAQNTASFSAAYDALATVAQNGTSITSNARFTPTATFGGGNIGLKQRIPNLTSGATLNIKVANGTGGGTTTFSVGWIVIIPVRIS